MFNVVSKYLSMLSMVTVDVQAELTNTLVDMHRILKAVLAKQLNKIVIYQQ